MEKRDCSTIEVLTTSSISEMASGEYSVLTYEHKKTRYGKSYILGCTCNTKIFSIWANSYISTYIDDVSPSKKFKIIIKDGRVTIPGYSRVVVLK